MLRINMNHTLPQIGLRTTPSQLSTHVEPARLSAHYRAPRSTQYVTQATVDIDSYPSRKAYGFRTMDDLTQEQGQKGLQDIQSRTSRLTQEAWEVIKNGPKQDGGAYCITMEKNKFWSSLSKGRSWHIEAQSIPNPTLTPHVSEVRGGMDTGSYDVNIDTKKDGADISYRPSRVETYLKQKGELNIWTEGSIDTFA